MKPSFILDSRKDDERANSQSDDAERERADAKQANAKWANKRKYFRIQYPPAAEPRVLTSPDIRIIDLSKQGVKFSCPKGSDDYPQSIEIDNSIRLKIQFHDDEVFEVKGKILRTYDDIDTNKTFFICLLAKEFSMEKISKEQRYLLKKYPDFCRALL